MMKDKVMGVSGISLVEFDFLVRMDSYDELNEFFNLSKYNYTNRIDVTKEEIERDLQSLEGRYVSYPGGSLYNTLSTLSELGVDVKQETMIGKDEYGSIIQDEISNKGIRANFQYSQNQNTHMILCFIAPDSDTKYKTCFGCFSEFQRAKVDFKELFTKTQMFIYEGYLLDFEPLRQLSKEAMWKAKNNGLTTVFTLCNTDITRERKGLIKDMFEYTDILIGNKAEFKELVHADDRGDLIYKLTALGKLSVVTLGGDGVLIVDARGNPVIINSPACHADSVVDTTGAGDNFAAGFLYAYLNGHSLELCAKIGNLLGKEVVKQVGTSLVRPESFIAPFLTA